MTKLNKNLELKKRSHRAIKNTFCKHKLNQHNICTIEKGCLRTGFIARKVITINIDPSDDSVPSDNKMGYMGLELGGMDTLFCK